MSYSYMGVSEEYALEYEEIALYAGQDLPKSPMLGAPRGFQFRRLKECTMAAYFAKLVMRRFFLLLGRVGGKFIGVGFQHLLLVCASHCGKVQYEQ
jgi:hypothetical protein